MRSIDVRAAVRRILEAGPPRTGLVLSGGGSRADFQLGALRYLYDEVGIEPDVITGTSAGSILAAVLAQSATAEGQRAGLAQLERIWLDMESSSEMFSELDWFERLRARGPALMAALARRQRRQGPLGRTFNRVANLRTHHGWLSERSQLEGGADGQAEAERSDEPAPDARDGQAGAEGTGAAGAPPPVREEDAPDGDSPDRTVAAEDPVAGAWTAADAVTLVSALRELGRARPDIEVILRGAERAQSMYRPGPIVEHLLDPEVFEPGRVAASGVTLRIAVVSLESGQLRYVTEGGRFVDRENRPVGDERLDLAEAIRASCAIPAVFPPVGLAGETYVDGGVRETLPAQVAMDHLGVAQCYAVVASPQGVRREGTYADRDILSIVLRSTAGIMSDESLRDEVAWAEAAGATVIAPELDLHDAMTVDPGLTAISMDYGYLRAAETVRRAGAAERHAGRELFRLRREIWRAENELLGPDRADPGSEPDLDRLVALKLRLREQVATVPAHHLPPGAENWWRGYERHPWDLPVPATWSGSDDPGATTAPARGDRPGDDHDDGRADSRGPVPDGRTAVRPARVGGRRGPSR